MFVEYNAFNHASPDFTSICPPVKILLMYSFPLLSCCRLEDTNRLEIRWKKAMSSSYSHVVCVELTQTKSVEELMFTLQKNVSSIAKTEMMSELLHTCICTSFMALHRLVCSVVLTPWVH